MHYLLFYEVGDDYIARRAAFRNVHLKLGWEAAERGELVMGGALANPVDGAVLLFKGDPPYLSATILAEAAACGRPPDRLPCRRKSATNQAARRASWSTNSRIIAGRT